jgi:hypothetical protein
LDDVEPDWLVVGVGLDWPDVVFDVEPDWLVVGVGSDWPDVVDVEPDWLVVGVGLDWPDVVFDVEPDWLVVVVWSDWPDVVCTTMLSPWADDADEGISLRLPKAGLLMMPELGFSEDGMVAVVLMSLPWAAPALIPKEPTTSITFPSLDEVADELLELVVPMRCPVNVGLTSAPVTEVDVVRTALAVPVSVSTAIGPFDVFADKADELLELVDELLRSTLPMRCPVNAWPTFAPSADVDEVTTPDEVVSPSAGLALEVELAMTGVDRILTLMPTGRGLDDMVKGFVSMASY